MGVVGRGDKKGWEPEAIGQNATLRTIWEEAYGGGNHPGKVGTERTRNRKMLDSLSLSYE